MDTSQVEINNTSADFVPAFADVVLRYCSEREKNVYLNFNQQIESADIDIAHTKLLLESGTYSPVQPSTVPYIVLTHVASDVSFLNWKSIFPQIKILKIMCDTKQQFELAYNQTYGNTEYVEQAWESYCAGFVNSAVEDITISANDITALNLNYLKGIL